MREIGLRINRCRPTDGARIALILDVSCVTPVDKEFEKLIEGLQVWQAIGLPGKGLLWNGKILTERK